MANREEALRRIFEATGADARLTDEQKRELLAHLEDAVSAKVAAGTPELDAVGQAFVELGDLKKLAREFPAAPPAAVTPEGVRLLADGRSTAWTALGFLGFFAVLGWFITPKFAAIFNQVKVPMPKLTMFFMTVSDLLRNPFIFGATALVIVGAVFALRRRRVPPLVAHLALLVSAGLCLGLVAALFLPLVSLLEGIGLRR